MGKATLMQIGTASGIVLPEDALDRMGWRQGEPVYVIDTPDGLLLTPYDTHTREQLSAGRQLLRDHRATLRALSE